MRVQWDMTDGRFWEVLKCEKLFLMFDTDAHVSNGVPDVPVTDVLHHVNGCRTCKDTTVQVHGATSDAPRLSYDIL